MLRNFLGVLLPISFGACTCGNGGGTMATPDASGARTVTISRPGGDVQLGSTDVEKIRAALESFIGANNATLDPRVPRTVGEAWIDEQDQVRAGPWLLEVRGDDLVLTCRQPPPVGRHSYRFAAKLVNDRGQWRVTSIEREDVIAR